jgi:N-acetyl-gamma-glutamyl-phosphate reductase
MLEQLGLEGGSLQFTPHLLPIPRGILSTIYVKLHAYFLSVINPSINDFVD